jgi:hypothetical protein
MPSAPSHIFYALPVSTYSLSRYRRERCPTGDDLRRAACLAVLVFKAVAGALCPSFPIFLHLIIVLTLPRPLGGVWLSGTDVPRTGQRVHSTFS